MDGRESQAKMDGLSIVHKWSGLVCRLRLKPNTRRSAALLAAPVVIVHKWIVRGLWLCLLLTHSLNVLLFISCALLL